jgi:hypothetical protein
MMVDQTVGELLKDRVTLDLEGIDRLYLNCISRGCRLAAASPTSALVIVLANTAYPVRD